MAGSPSSRAGFARDVGAAGDQPELLRRTAPLHRRVAHWRCWGPPARRNAAPPAPAHCARPAAPGCRPGNRKAPGDRTGPARPWCRRYRRRSGRRSCRRWSGAWQARLPHSISRSAPRAVWRGTRMVRRSGKRPRSRSCAGSMVSSSPGWVWAASSTGRLPICRAQCRQRGFIAGQRRGIGLQAAHHLHIARAQLAEALRDVFVLRQHHVERRTAAAARFACAQPQRSAERAEMRALTSASFTPRAARAQDQVGPQVGFHEQAGIRFPVIQKARHRAGRVQRHELVQRALAAGAGSSWRRW